MSECCDDHYNYEIHCPYCRKEQGPPPLLPLNSTWQSLACKFCEKLFECSGREVKFISYDSRVLTCLHGGEHRYEKADRFLFRCQYCQDEIKKYCLHCDFIPPDESIKICGKCNSAIQDGWFETSMAGNHGHMSYPMCKCPMFIATAGGGGGGGSGK